MLLAIPEQGTTDAVSNNFDSEPFTFTSQEQIDKLKAHGIAPGFYKMRVAVEHGDTKRLISESVQLISFEVRDVADEKTMTPSYSWQQVLEGQSVPSGLEIALVLSAGDGSGDREARIPPSWRIQVSSVKCHFSTTMTIFMHQFEDICHNIMHDVYEYSA